MSEQSAIKNNGDLKKYRHELPNIYDDDLNPYEYRLVGHYVRRDGCWEGTRKTAEICQMSAGKVSETRKSLQERGYITIEYLTKHQMFERGFITVDSEDPTTHCYVEVVDKWLENMQRYSKKTLTHSSGEQGRSSGEQGRSSGERKNKPNKKNQISSSGAVSISELWSQYGGNLDYKKGQLLSELEDTDLTEAQLSIAFNGSRYMSNKLLQDMARQPETYALAADLITNAPPGIATVDFETALNIARGLIKPPGKAYEPVTEASVAIARLQAYMTAHNSPKGSGLRMLTRPEVAGYTNGGGAKSTAARLAKAQQETVEEVPPEVRQANAEAMRKTLNKMRQEATA